MTENDAPKISVDNIGKSEALPPTSQATDVHKPLTSVHLSSLDKNRLETPEKQAPIIFESSGASKTPEQRTEK